MTSIPHSGIPQSGVVRNDRKAADIPIDDPEAISFFEFWPTWLIYLPVVLLWLGKAVRYRSLSLPLLANPDLPLGGMVGVSKARLQDTARKPMATALLPYQVVLRSDQSGKEQVLRVLPKIERDLGPLPLVCKPDIGCRGAGVKLVHSADELAEVFEHYPAGAGMMLQRLAQAESEAGIFYVRRPNEEMGRITSMAFKHTPYVTGDGQHTVAELVSLLPRASKLQYLYKKRLAARWNEVLTPGERLKLVFSASHCRGAIFRDARAHVTPELIHTVDQLMKALPNFHYGRLDVKFADLPKLKKGQSIEVIEINTVSSEPLHIWDGRAKFRDAIGALMDHYRELFEIGAQVREQGVRPPGIMALLDGLRKEQSLVATYPPTD